MAVTAAMVKELRELTGSGMMDCKKALVESDGDIDKAVDWLREKGIMKAQKKSGRIAAEGLVRLAFADDHKSAGIVEINSETDFVAKNQEFVDYVQAVADLALVKGNESMEQFLAEPFEGSTLSEVHTAKVAKIGENLNIRRFARVEEDGVVYAGYVHGGGRIGVIVGIKTEATPEEIEMVGKDVAMQVASMNPKFVDEDGVDPEYLESEKKILTEQVLNEGKKPEMVDRIVAGKIKKELKEVCLVDQPFVKNSDLSVKQYVDSVAKEMGKPMQVVSMVRYEVGEGIEKKEDDFAAEVAAAAKA
ncbi:MAG: translation elongation factor Ts [Eubacteriales bacterium]|jgi:elongation factor Ts|uniref:translation elongation factor Ts n=1 Tax=Baileyella intestinalis TaxID=2606709 RepID=UPI0023EFB522|nr:translation elongation factor Ts [Baileyella intestinalis]MCI7685821.1 translation elongation factor Ts [Clostridiales bacterium]MDD5875503.1 translation elongation factor Ts [Baileyella intestinalis]MDY2994446.1 translation elongation factor Ts [Baileyella intestinalis]